MKFRESICLCAAVLALISAASAQLDSHSSPYAKHHRYRLIDLGPGGGPNSAISTQSAVLTNHGKVVGWADTADHDPYDPDCFFDCFVTHAAEWRHGVLHDLGALADGVSSAAIAVNANGLIDGVSENGEIDPLTGFPKIFAVVWKNGKIINLGSFGGNQSATGGVVSNNGYVVGGALNDVLDPLANDFSLNFMFVPAATQCHAFLWRGDSGLQDLGTLGGPESIAGGVNERGQVSGQSYTNSIVNSVTGLPTLDPFLWENGRMTDIGSLGGNFGLANWMNSSGQVVGVSDLEGDLTFHPYVWGKGRPLRDLGTLGGDNGAAFSINDAGAVVGNADITGSQAHHAFLWQPGRPMRDLGTPDGDTCSTAYSVNSHMQVVGNSGICGIGGHAFLWENGGPPVNLENLVLPGSELEVSEADYINDRGEIVCSGFLPTGESHACLLIPTDEYAIGDGNERGGVAPRQAVSMRQNINGGRSRFGGLDFTRNGRARIVRQGE